MNDEEKKEFREHILRIVSGYLTSTIQIFNLTEEVMDEVGRAISKSEFRKSNDWK